MYNYDFKIITCLHILLFIYSLGGIFSKLAAGTAFFSTDFLQLYTALLLILFLYAIGWQQILKRMPLTLAFANKAITIVWGIVFGKLFFNEEISIGKIIGALLIMAGIILYAYAEHEGSYE